MMKRSKPGTSCLIASLVLCLACAAVVRAQDDAKAGNQLGAGKPLKDVELKLLKDGKTVATTTSDEKGEFRFAAVPQGEYTLALELPKDTGPGGAPGGKSGGADLAMTSGAGTVGYITLNLPGGKKVEKGYDFSKQMAFEPPDQSDPSAARRGPQFMPFTYESDGTTPCNGAINTSRSNIKNTF